MAQMTQFVLLCKSHALKDSFEEWRGREAESMTQVFQETKRERRISSSD